MNYNPLYGSMPYAGHNKVVYAGGGWRTALENGMISLSPFNTGKGASKQKFENLYKLFVNENGYDPNDIKTFLTGNRKANEVLDQKWTGLFGPYGMSKDLKMYYKDAGLTEDDLEELALKYTSSTGSVDTNVEESVGDTNPNAEEETPEEETPEEETPAAGGGTGGSTGSTGSGPAEVGEIGASQGAGQQTGGYDLDAIQQAFDRINAYIAQQQQQQQQQPQPQQPAPEQPQYRIGVGDLLGMDRWQRNQLRRGRDVQLANGEWVSPTSRWSGRHLAHDVRTERRHGRRDARRDYLSQYYNPARKARYDKRKDSRADREASHYVNIGQYVLPYENDKA